MNEKLYKLDKRDKPENAMLTRAHREYLQSDKSGYTASTQSDYEKAIARRVYNTYLDFSLLFEELPKNRRSEILDVSEFHETETVPNTSDAANELNDALIDTISFLFLLMEERNGGLDSWPHQQTFQTIVGPGVEKALKRIHHKGQHWTTKVNAELSTEVTHIEQTDVDRAIDKIAEGNVSELSGGEARSLIELADKSETHSSAFMEGWGDLGQRIQERRDERDDIRTQEDWNEIAERSDEE